MLHTSCMLLISATCYLVLHCCCNCLKWFHTYIRMELYEDSAKSKNNLYIASVLVTD